MSYVIDFKITLTNTSEIGDGCCQSVDIDFEAGQITGIHIIPADNRPAYSMRLPDQEDIETITSKLSPMR